jgi:hypothetical protein
MCGRFNFSNQSDLKNTIPEKEFEWYWKDFVSSGNRFHPGSLQEVIDWDYRKTLLKEDNSQIIRLPRSIKNKLNFEELIKN